jgi:glyoxylase-like metal-dependent hydrolase (beta-lactamase superfamily II)
VHVFVRDWLSSNNILLKDAHGCVLVDSGYSKHNAMTLALLASPRGLDGAPLARLVNTHCHSDHMGGNAAIRKAYGCPVAIPEGEAKQLENWNDPALLLGYADQHVEPFVIDEIIRPGTTQQWAGREWRAIAAPGHDMGALVFFNEETRILISGDALWQNGYGYVVPQAFDPDAFPAARATLEMIAGLNARVVIPGHGEPFTDVEAALERAFSRTAALEADPVKNARLGIKVLLTFHLLECERMALRSVPDYLARIGVYRDLNAHYLRLEPGALAERVIGELTTAGVLRIDGEDLLPAP